MLALLALGFFLGLRHATDADHVIAVSTIVSRHRSLMGAAAIGAAWGLGHTLTILTVGGAMVLFQWVIPPRIGLSMEAGVGLMLIGLGVANIRSFFRRAQVGVAAVDQGSGGSVHTHPHAHGDWVHTHAHGHDPEAHPHAADRNPVTWLDRRLGGLGLYQLIRPMLVGVVHGLAGSAAVALLVLATVTDPGWALIYLLLFGLGTIAGMMVITAAIAVPFATRAGPLARFQNGFHLAAGIASVAFGAVMVASRVG